MFFLLSRTSHRNHQEKKLKSPQKNNDDNNDDIKKERTKISHAARKEVLATSCSAEFDVLLSMSTRITK